MLFWILSMHAFPPRADRDRIKSLPSFQITRVRLSAPSHDKPFRFACLSQPHTLVHSLSLGAITKEKKAGREEEDCELAQKNSFIKKHLRSQRRLHVYAIYTEISGIF